MLLSVSNLFCDSIDNSTPPSQPFSRPYPQTGNTKGESITVQLTSRLTGLESAVWQLTIFVFICKTGLFKPVKQEVNGSDTSHFNIPCHKY
jgi:hypothetical protein